MVVGQKVQLTPEGPVYRVKRINACAAYLESLAQRHVRIEDPRTGEVREFDGADGRTIAVSPNAFLYYPEED